MTTIKDKSKNLQAVLIVGVFILVNLIGFVYVFFGEEIVFQLRTHDKIFSFVNYYEDPITININDQSYEVLSDEGFSTQISGSDFTIVGIHNDEEVLNKSYSFDTKPYGVLNLLGPEEQTSNKCVIEARIDDLFYSNFFERFALEATGEYEIDTPYKELQIEDNSIEVNHKFINETVLFPGEYVGEKLDRSIDIKDRDEVLGIFVVDCSIIVNETFIQEDIINQIFFE